MSWGSRTTPGSSHRGRSVDRERGGIDVEGERENGRWMDVCTNKKEKESVRGCGVSLWAGRRRRFSRVGLGIWGTSTRERGKGGQRLSHSVLSLSRQGTIPSSPRLFSLFPLPFFLAAGVRLKGVVLYAMLTASGLGCVRREYENGRRKGCGASR